MRMSFRTISYLIRSPAGLLCPTSSSKPISPVVKALTRRMSDHLDRTAHNFRQTGISDATIVAVKDGSSTVKLLTVQVSNPDFRFKAGQWVDFFIPGIRTVGGYSMYTPPSLLQKSLRMGLAVKYSEHAPAYWVHTQCKAGAKVGVRVGGDQIIYDPSPSDPSWDLLLIAGGIGINPMYSILQHARDLYLRSLSDPTAYRPGRVEFLYSASTSEELIFKESIQEIANDTENISCHFHVTREAVIPTSHTSDHRINGADLATSLQRLDKDRLRCFLCGPPPMIADMESLLESQGVRPDQLHTEKWW
ncbi:oxidoreductase NAD-binding domain-containing protein 1-like isoform X2 [Acanthaster planci]|uniref:Oxidoreductase NAD-binding domain-containing protein 1-like isoform X2 n=1 Tax=Acanthaster planci TaxID=133434 RepID=A0A8B7ZC04_ACAPL|nr:oxidoreductase NAD-binding domain-containing protein 1-like isoform X2 [Acanthaster planci]